MLTKRQLLVTFSRVLCPISRGFPAISPITKGLDLRFWHESRHLDRRRLARGQARYRGTRSGALAYHVAQARARQRAPYRLLAQDRRCRARARARQAEAERYDPLKFRE